MARTKGISIICFIVFIVMYTTIFMQESPFLVVLLPHRMQFTLVLSPSETSTDGKDLDAMVRVGSTNTSSEIIRHETGNSTSHKNNSTCDYANGEWVADDRRPFYSGFGCRQWLSKPWSCKITGRTDFAYEKFRWQPKDCNMDKFSGSKFLERMRDKTVAFIGDSLGQQQFQSLMCMITGGKERHDIKDVGRQYKLVKYTDPVRPKGWAYRFLQTNTTILYHWSVCLCDLQQSDLSDPTSEVAMHLDRPPPFLRKFIHRFDVLVLNTGHHWNRGKLAENHRVIHTRGVPMPDMDLDSAKNFTIHSIVSWVDSQLTRHPHLKALYRSISPRHFFQGDWNTGGTCNNVRPLSTALEAVTVQPGDLMAVSAVKGTKVKLLDITALSKLRDEGHLSKYTYRAKPGTQDCLHWCLPGIPDTWNEIFYDQLMTELINRKSSSSVNRAAWLWDWINR